MTKETTLTQAQITSGYFNHIGGFPPLNETRARSNPNYATEVREYLGQEKLCIACTQLDGRSEREKKRILAEWVDYLRSNPKQFKALHFNSRVPQELFDAACCQWNLTELRFKWGPYSDLSALENLGKLQFLYIGTGTSVLDITPITKLNNLKMLYVQNFKRISDYSQLTALEELEQLIISGPIYGSTPVSDIDFLVRMKKLVSVWLPATKILKKYTRDELINLKKEMSGIHDMFDSVWGRYKL